MSFFHVLICSMDFYPVYFVLKDFILLTETYTKYTDYRNSHGFFYMHWFSSWTSERISISVQRNWQGDFQTNLTTIMFLLMPWSIGISQWVFSFRDKKDRNINLLFGHLHCKVFRHLGAPIQLPWPENKT